MTRLDDASPDVVGRLVRSASARAADRNSFDASAQDYTDALFTTFDETCVLARIFVTAPFGTLPDGIASVVRRLAADKSADGELRPDTQVLLLAGSSGRRPEWNGRTRSRGHVGIPLISSAFIDDIPMMSRLLGSMGHGLSWMDVSDEAERVHSIGRLGGLFWVPDARATTDSRGRPVIADQGFVAENGVVSVFALANASPILTGALMTLVVFASEALDETRVPVFQDVLTHLRQDSFETVTAGKLFA